jgi:hypothetical protein
VVGAIGDAHEQQADRVGARVAKALAPSTTDPAATPGRPTTGERISRRASSAPRASGGDALGGKPVDPDVGRAISAARGTGRPLEPTTRSAMEHAFGADLSSVRVHTGAASSKLNDHLESEAFTVGSDVFFRESVPSLQHDHGRELVAHELAHTLQQGDTPTVHRWPWSKRSKKPKEPVISGPVNGRAMSKQEQGGVKSMKELIAEHEEQKQREASEQLERERAPKRAMALAPGRGPGISDEAAEGVGKMFGDAELEAERSQKRKMALAPGKGPGISDEGAEGVGNMFLRADAERFLQHILAGGDESGLKVTRKEMLDTLQNGLSDEDFSLAAAALILSLPGTVVDSKETKAEAMRILKIELYNKDIARRLLDQETKCVVVPKNKKMTDLVEFKSLAGTKTFDGRKWEDVRGSGGFKVPGKQGIYVAVAEENITGTDATGDAAGTQWCYAKGYSTTSHEMAHVIDRYGLADEDRKKVDDLYEAKQKLEATQPQEWIDGYNGKKGKLKPEAAIDAWKVALKGKKDGATLEPLLPHVFSTAAVDWKSPSFAPWLPYAKTAGIVSADGKSLLDPKGAVVGTIDDQGSGHFHGGPPFKTQTCYAAAHRLEYFAQGANAYFGTNTGIEPYVGSWWKSQGDESKGTRRNGKAELKRIEPELYKVMEKVFGKNADMTGANPRQ